MEYWSSGEVESTVGDSFRVAMNILKEKVNLILSNESFLKYDINNLDVIYIIFEDGGIEKQSYKSKSKMIDLRVVIDYRGFLNATPTEQIIILANGLLDGLEKITEKNKNLKHFDILKFREDLNKILNIKNSHFEEVFENLKSKEFDTSIPLTWSFYFFSDEKSKLQQVIKELDGYNYVTELSKSEKEFKLIASKVEILTPSKLERRNIAFSELADWYNVIYDGWEVTKQDEAENKLC